MYGLNEVTIKAPEHKDGTTFFCLEACASPNGGTVMQVYVKKDGAGAWTVLFNGSASSITGLDASRVFRKLLETAEDRANLLNKIDEAERKYKAEQAKEKKK